ncbi:MAG: DUF1732 domain-containing protein [Candidatus Erginobacter occultus]|nr:DUF1732 domain-containing protein [Candidatus Erginobacter occultus]
MYSMTGYGQGSGQGKNFTVKTELQSYNHRFLDIKVRLPNEYGRLENWLSRIISGQVSRGRVNVYVGFQQSGDRYQVRVNEDLARKYWKALRRLQGAVKAQSEIGPEVLIGLPGVLETVSGLPTVTSFKKQLAVSLEEALGKMVGMRAKEGARLRADLNRHLKTFIRSFKKVKTRIEKRARADAPPERKGKKTSPSAGFPPNVEEELSRLEGHLEQFAEYLDTSQPVGKTLEFLLQEMQREVTTLGDKAGDSVVSTQVILMKSELESLREQARNVE